MYSRKGFIGILALSILLLASAVSFGQIGTVAGRVVKKDDKGKMQPVEKVKISCYRTDTEQTCRSTETDSKGFFSILGIPIGGKFILGVSGPGLQPTFVPETTCGKASDNIDIVVLDGDGTEATEEQVRASAAAAVTGELSEEQKKAAAELEKKRLEILEKNKKIEENNATRERAGKEGTAAFQNKDFDTAIAKFEEGYNADPTFLGAAPLFLNNIAISYTQRGVTKYTHAGKAGKAAEGKKLLIEDLRNSLVAAMKARALLKGANASELGNAEAQKDFAKKNEDVIKDAFRILAQLNANLLDYEDPDEKRAAAIKLYRDGYEAQPTNENVMAGLSFALYMESEISGDKALRQESLNFGSKVLKSIDDKHPLHEAVKGIVDLLLDEKLKPQAIN